MIKHIPKHEYIHTILGTYGHLYRFFNTSEKLSNIIQFLTNEVHK